MIKKYRKKPVVIEALQYKTENDWEGIDEIVKFLTFGKEIEFVNDTPFKGMSMNRDNFHISAVRGSDYEGFYIIIKTLEGEMVVSDGDFIIKGVKNEFYPCKPDIFRKTYSEVETIFDKIYKKLNNVFKL